MSQPIIFSNNELYGYIDVENPAELRGWICGKDVIEAVYLIIEKSKEKVPIIYGNAREDVRNAHPGYENSLYSGFHAKISRELFKFGNKIVFEVLFKGGNKAFSENITLKTMEAVEKLKAIEGLAEFVHSDVPLAKSISHGKWLRYLENKFNKPGVDVLEIGSRDVIDASMRNNFSKANYIGFDYYEGKNVDVAGDAHKLSSYFPGKKFDLIFSNAVFEHLAMPWVVSKEIVRLLKVGGYVFIETHYSYGSHSRPWHFFQFSEEALKILFNPKMGIECIEAGVSNPICGFFGSKSEEYLKYQFVTGLYCHADFFGKKVNEVENFDWNNSEVCDIVNHTTYPRSVSGESCLSYKKQIFVNQIMNAMRGGRSRIFSLLNKFK